MAIREELELDLSRALSQVDDLERQLDSLLQPVELPLTVSDQATNAIRDLDRELAGIESSVAGISQDLSLMEAAAGSAEVDVSQLAQALGVSEDEASQLVGEFAEATLEARELEAATREVAAALGLSEQDARDLARQMERVSSETREVNASSRTAAGGVGLLGGNFRSLITTVGAYVGVQEFFRFASQSIDAASDLEESLSKTRVVFGGFADDIETFSIEAPSALGLSNQAALEATATFGNLFTALGLTRAEAAELSPEIVQLGADLASFNNIEVDDALTALRSGLVGEVEPLRRLGVAINAATVEAKALELGLVGASGEISEAAKVQARYQLILEQTTNAQGDFARTADGIANRQRTLSANFENLQASIGTALLPAFEGLLESGEDLLPLIEDLSPVIGLLAEAFVGLLEPVGLVVDGLGLLIQPIQDIAGAAGDLEDIDPSGLEDLSRATQELIDPTDSVKTLLDELATFLQTGLDTATIRGEFEDLANALELGLDPSEQLLQAFAALAEQGNVTSDILAGIIEIARNSDVADSDLVSFLTSALEIENLSPSEIDAVASALQNLVFGFTDAASARADFENATGQTPVPEFVASLDDVNAALARVQFEKATGQLDDFKSAFPEPGSLSLAFDIEVPDLETQIDQIESQIDQIPDALSAAKEALKDEEGEIVDDFDEFFANLQEELEARQQFAQNLAILRSLGFDDLANQFAALGLDSAQALADGLADPAALAQAEQALEGFSTSIQQSFAADIAAAVSEGTDNIEDLKAAILSVDGLGAVARIQVFFEAIGAIDSRSVFEGNQPGAQNAPATTSEIDRGDTNITINQGPSADPGVTAARTAQAVGSAIVAAD